MKTNEEMIASVFERKQKYEAQKAIARKKMKKIAASLGVVCLVLTLVFGGASLMGSGSGEYKVILDVNPSLAIRANGDDRVLSVEALNADGEKIIGGRDFEGDPTGEVVRELTETMVDQGYISQEANSVLVSVEGKDTENRDKIGAEIAGTISSSLEASDIEGAIIVQSIDGADEGTGEIANEHGISPGKAKLIAQIVAQNGFHTYEELAAMTVNELNLLRISYYIELNGSQISGNPSALSYLGDANAVQIARAASGESLAEAEVNLECYRGVMNYRVEFETADYEYRYRINAVTGEVLSEEKVEVGGKGFFEGDREVATVGENAALSAALDHAGVDNAKLIRCQYKTDWADGTVLYDIQFSDGRVSCKYVVNARTGEIIRYGKTEEYRDRSVSASLIGEAAAKQKALAKYGIVDGSISKYEMDLKRDGEAYRYEIFYICNSVKYQVTLDAADGTVLHSEKTDLRDTGAPSVETGDRKSDEDR